jgi:hypothetical protein
MNRVYNTSGTPLKDQMYINHVHRRRRRSAM